MKLKKVWEYIADHEMVIIKILLEEDGFGSVEECIKADRDPSWIALEAEVKQICTRDGTLYIEVNQ